MKKLTIQQWNPDDRPREKLLAKGAEALTDAELLAILIGSGNAEENAVDLSKRILASVNNDLNVLGRCSVAELAGRFKGIGEAKAITIVAAAEFGLRRKRFETERRDVVQSSGDIYRLMYADLADKPHEEMWVILLNSANRIIARKRVAQGGVGEVSVDLRLILREVVLALASRVILCHNHPSGNLQPSKQDIRLTERVTILLGELNSRLLDHVILTDNGYFSFADEGKM